MLWYCLLGFVLGIITSLIVVKRSLSGTLKVVKSDEENDPYLFVELDKPVESIVEKRFVLFDVERRIIDSRK